MAQFTVRLDDELARQVKAYAAALGRSVNGWVVAVLGAAVDPDLADSESERTHARLARVGLLLTPGSRHAAAPPDAERVRRARKAAGAGTRLSELVSEGRR